MNRRAALTGAIVSALLLIGADDRDEKRGGFARYVEGGEKEDLIGGLANLHIEEIEGRVELNGGYRDLAVVLAAYKDGKPVDLPEVQVTGLGVYETNGTIRYAMEVVDLDFLPLGDGKKGHCRLRVSLRMPDGSSAAFERDIPKRLVSLARNGEVSTERHFFLENVSTNREVPLVCFKAGGHPPERPPASRHGLRVRQEERGRRTPPGQAALQRQGEVIRAPAGPLHPHRRSGVVATPLFSLAAPPQRFPSSPCWWK